MPTYEYECVKCEHVFDVFHNMTAKPRVKCPECGGRTKKLIGAGAGIIFKGSGFYETDYKRKSTAGAPQRDRETPTEKPAETKKEDKKEAKTQESKKD
jgi:putative FmdB family regulatory protein